MDISGINQHTTFTQSFSSFAGSTKLNNANVNSVKEEMQKNESVEPAYYQAEKKADTSITNDLNTSQPADVTGEQQPNIQNKQVLNNVNSNDNSNKSPSNLVLGTLVDKKV